MQIAQISTLHIQVFWGIWMGHALDFYSRFSACNYAVDGYRLYSNRFNDWANARIDM